MKKTGKILVFFIILVMLYTIIGHARVYADPNSSKGFAEYDEEKAEEENKKMLEQQEKELTSVMGKSTDNYLENLEVEGYTLLPQFDKQTIEYVIDGKKAKEIHIIATPSDEKAKVEGSGNIKLEEGQKQCKIHVTAQSGTVRTYTIYISEEEKEEQEKAIEENDNMPVQEVKQDMTEEESKDTEGNKKGIFIIVGVVLGIIVMLGLVKKNKRKGKH